MATTVPIEIETIAKRVQKIRARLLLISGMIIEEMLTSVRSWWDTAVYLVPCEEHVYLTSRVGQILQIPSRILVSDPDYRVIAYGVQAREVEYAGTQRTKVLSPFTPNTIVDEVGSRLLLRAMIWEALGSRFLLKPVVHVVLPPNTSSFMRELWQRALFSAGARQVHAWHPALAAAGAVQLPYHTPHGYVVGWSDESSIGLTLLAFGQVQKETIMARHWKKGQPIDPTEVQQLWQKFLTEIPVEFAQTVQTDGILWVTEESLRGQARAWSQALGSPVAFLPWANLPLGLRQLTNSEGQK